MVEVKAQLRHARMSAKKVRLVTDVIKGLSVEDAILRLHYVNRISAPIVLKLLQSAVANAQHNNNLSKESLVVKNVTVDQAVALKRWRPAAFGAAHPFKKHGCHITVVLGLKSGAGEQPKKASPLATLRDRVSRKKKDEKEEMTPGEKKTAARRVKAESKKTSPAGTPAEKGKK